MRAMILAVPLLLAPARHVLAATDGYPTATRAEYVFACMTVGGNNSAALQRCACAVDVIASLVTYDDYERAETVLRMRQGPVGGYLSQEFHVTESNAMVERLQEAQAEAEVRCF